MGRVCATAKQGEGKTPTNIGKIAYCRRMFCVFYAYCIRPYTRMRCGGVLVGILMRVLTGRMSRGLIGYFPPLNKTDARFAKT
jgi:hypothetical protein